MKQRPIVLIRADASPTIGGGHIVRTLALGLALNNVGFQVALVTRPETLATVPFIEGSKIDTILLDCTTEEEPDFLSRTFSNGLSALVVDHYERGLEFETSCRTFANTIIAVDDTPSRHHDCDILIDQTLGRQVEEYKGFVPTHCHVLAGIDYALLRPQFSLARLKSGKHIRQNLNRLMVMVGAGSAQEVTLSVLKILNKFPNALSVDIIGSGFTDCDISSFKDTSHHELSFYSQVSEMASLLNQADLAIGAAGSASWERCCLGVPALLFVIADNQVDILKALEFHGVARNLGWFNEVSKEKLINLIEKIYRDPSWLESASKKAYNLCDGKGAERVALILRELLLIEGQNEFRH